MDDMPPDPSVPPPERQKKKPYPPIKERLRLELERVEVKRQQAIRKSRAQAEGEAPAAAPAPAPTAAPQAPAAPPPPEPGPDGELGIGAALTRFVDAHRGGDAAMAAGRSPVVGEYLRPYLKRLEDLEANLPGFSTNATVPWPEIESVAIDPMKQEPLTRLADRFGVKAEAVYAMAKERKWKARRAVLGELAARQSAAIALSAHASALAGDTVGAAMVANPEDAEERRTTAMIEKALTVFEGQIANMQFKPRDADTLIRLLHFLKGKAERIEERRHRVSPEQLEAIAAKVAKRIRFAPELAGVVRDAEFRTSEPLDVAAEFEDVPEPS